MIQNVIIFGYDLKRNSGPLCLLYIFIFEIWHLEIRDGMEQVMGGKQGLDDMEQVLDGMELGGMGLVLGGMELVRMGLVLGRMELA